MLRLSGWRLSRTRSQFANQSEIGRRVPPLFAVPIFAKRDIDLPMQTILDAPVTPQRFPIITGAGYLAANEIARFLTGLSTDYRPLTITHADGLDPSPILTVAQPVGALEHGIAPVFFPPMTAL